MSHNQIYIPRTDYHIRLFLDLKQELKIRNIAIPKKHDSECEENEPMDTSASPSKNHLPKKDVCRLNDINDSRNNNSFMTSSVRSSSVNTSSLNDTTILNNMSFENSMTTTTPSHNNNNIDNPIKSQMQTNSEQNLSKSTQPNSILKCKFLKLLTCCRIVD